MVCGKPVRYEETEKCRDCSRNLHHYESGRSLWLHKFPVNCSVYQFKYHNRRRFAKFYAQELYRLYHEELKRWKIEIIIPVPLHKKRRKKRGYNQAEILAKELSKLLNLPMNQKLVKRVRNTSPQKQLSTKQRKHNLNNAFAMNTHSVAARSVLVVDDIYTTGSTIDHIALLLKEHGAEKVHFLTISIGQGF